MLQGNLCPGCRDCGPSCDEWKGTHLWIDYHEDSDGGAQWSTCDFCNLKVVRETATAENILKKLAMFLYGGKRPGIGLYSWQELTIEEVEYLAGLTGKNIRNRDYKK